MNDIFIIIPTLNPNTDLLTPFIDELKKKFKNILVYNDGSRDEYNTYFKNLEKKGIIVLHHYINLGKGRAMKDAFNYLLNEYPNLKGVVTADSDGQHGVKDICNVADMVLKYSDSLILGCRNFNGKNVPKRNRFGNKMTTGVLKAFVGISVSDTQTGLRGLPKEVMVKLIDSQGERFEYETNQLIDTISKDIPIKEVSIETIYVNGNSESHFNPIKDSIAIYKQFMKYIIASISSFVIDIGLFTLFANIFKFNNYILVSTIIARIISSMYNYLVNSKLVFKKKNSTSFIKYYILVIIQMFVSGYSVTLLSNVWHFNLSLIKFIVDVIIFIANFIIQREFVFKGAKYEK